MQLASSSNIHGYAIQKSGADSNLLPPFLRQLKGNVLEIGKTLKKEFGVVKFWVAVIFYTLHLS